VSAESISWSFRPDRNSKGGIVSIHHRSVMIALLSLCLAAPGQLAAQSHQTESERPGLHDFDFLVGQWRAHHRKLKQRLANNHEWTEFEGTLLNQPLMGGYSNVDDTVLNVPGAPYHGVALRAFDPKTQQWSIWWLDSRTPSEPLDPPMIGLPQWRGHFLWGRYGQGKASSGAIHLVQHHSDIGPLGAGGLARRGQDLGDKLGAGHHTSSLIEGVGKIGKMA
jgi:hypothetical protein